MRIHFSTPLRSLSVDTVQIATLPEFPQIDEKSQIRLRITDVDFNEIDGFTLGMRVFHAGEQINAWAPTFYDGSHWDHLSYHRQSHSL